MADRRASLDELVENALERAYLGALSDVGRSVLLEERNRREPEPEPGPEPGRDFFSHSRLPPPGWHFGGDGRARTQRIAEPEPEPEPELEPEPEAEPEAEPEPEPDQGRLEERCSGATKAAVSLGQKALGLAALRLEHRQRAAEVRNAQLVASSARAKEVRLRGEAVARAKAAHAAMVASARYTELRPASWRQNDPSSSRGADNESWRSSPYQVPQQADKAWLNPGRTAADAAQSVSEGIQAMAQKSARANRLVVTERHGGLVVQIHRLQPPPQPTATMAPKTAAHKRAGRSARALRLGSDAPSSLCTKVTHQLRTASGSARAKVITGGLEVTPGLNGSAESRMMLRDGEHTPLPAQFVSHHSPMPRPPKTGGSRSGGSPGGRCRVLISSPGEAAGIESPGPAAYHAAVAYARLNSPRSFMRRADAHSSGVAFGTTAAQRPVGAGSIGIRGAVAGSEASATSASGPAAVPAMEGGAWGTGLGVFEETSWTKHIPLVAHEPKKPPQICPLLSV